MTFIKELCVENCELLTDDILCRVDRIELCDNLAVGGTTVSAGVGKLAVSRCQEHSVNIAAMIRPRGGNFVYSKDEIEAMLEDIKVMRDLGVDGVVFGAVTSYGQMDYEAIDLLLTECGGMETVFHMAFDVISEKYKYEGLDFLLDRRFSRLLTHGGPKRTKIESNLATLAKYCAYTRGHLTILPGGGVTFLNGEAIAKHLGISELHGTKIIKY